MKDILPPESDVWEELRSKASEIFSSFGYSFTITPVVEKTELFVRSVGEHSDIVTKEMYTFNDRSGESITLRPESTASIMRAYLSNSEWRGRLFKTWSWGPMFRHERPQKGRYRQFYQFNLEAIGTDSPYVDAELIFMLDLFYRKVGIDDLSIEINSLGCIGCRPRYKKDLVEFFHSQRDSLCGDCRKRLDSNPLRVLDCKNSKCLSIRDKAPVIDNYLCKDCATHYGNVKETIGRLGVSYSVNPYLVRGLDYYTKTVFEFTSERLGGRQNALGGGGRYDDLSTQIGGKTIPSVGYAGGVERTVMLMDREGRKEEKISIYIAIMDEETLRQYMPLILELKRLSPLYSKNSIKFDFVDEGFRVASIKKHLAKASRIGSRFAIIAGELELKDSVVTVKDLVRGEETRVDIAVDDLKFSVDNIFGRLVGETNA